MSITKIIADNVARMSSNSGADAKLTTLRGSMPAIRAVRPAPCAKHYGLGLVFFGIAMSGKEGDIIWDGETIRASNPNSLMLTNIIIESVRPPGGGVVFKDDEPELFKWLLAWDITVPTHGASRSLKPPREKANAAGICANSTERITNRLSHDSNNQSLPLSCRFPLILRPPSYDVHAGLRRERPSGSSARYALPFGRLWYGEPNAISNAVGFAKFYSRSHDAVIRVRDEAGNVIIPKTRRPVPKHGTRVWVPFTLIASQ